MVHQISSKHGPKLARRWFRVQIPDPRTAVRGTLLPWAGTSERTKSLADRVPHTNRGMGTSLRASSPYPGWLWAITPFLLRTQNATPQGPKQAASLSMSLSISRISQQPRPSSGLAWSRCSAVLCSLLFLASIRQSPPCCYSWPVFRMLPSFPHKVTDGSSSKVVLRAAWTWNLGKGWIT